MISIPILQMRKLKLKAKQIAPYQKGSTHQKRDYG